MEISKERLQEIKDKHLLTGNEEWTSQEDVDTEAVIKELITAVEQAQAELAEAEERDDAMDIIGVADKRTIADLRKEVKRLKATNGGE